jgi:small-conductance mechanosensitive channel
MPAAAATIFSIGRMGRSVLIIRFFRSDMNELRDLAGQVYYGNTLRDWAIALIVFVLLFTVLPLIRVVIRNRLRKPRPHQSRETLEIVVAVIKRTTRLFLIAVAIWLSTRSLTIPSQLDRALDVALLVIVWFQVALWGTTIVGRLVQPRGSAAAEGDASLNILRFIATVLVWSIALLMLLANLGVEIMPLVAGLGIGGIALALAVQNVLGDLLASLSIALDKPFRVGDFLVLGEEKGTVEQIGIKSTRLRSTTGEQIVMANGELLKSRLRNYGLLPERRAELALRIAYETPRKQVAEIPAIIEAAIRAQPKVRFERAHLARLGDYAFIYEAVYHVQDRDLTAFMDAQQQILLRLLEELAGRDIGVVYPTTRAVSATPPKEG